MIQPLNVLLVEDSHGDVALVREALKSNGLAVQLHVVLDGEQALCFLRKDEPYEQAPTPDLVLLDLNIPRVHGHDVLATMRQLGLHYIPVAILSSSSDEDDIRKAYELCANAYLEKPLELEPYFARVRATVEYFGTHVSRLSA
jgi:DNA-binding response OmpR family regulator